MSKSPNNTVRFNMLPINVKDKLTIDENIYILKFPSKLYEFLQMAIDKYNRNKKRKSYIKNIYIRPLSNVIKSKYNSIITTDNGINQYTLDDPWIYSFDKYDLDIFKQYIKEWLEQEPHISKSVDIDISDDCFDEFIWEQERIELYFRHNEIGTSLPDKDTFNFFLSYIGHKLNGKIEVSTEGIEEEVTRKGETVTVSGKKSISYFKFYNVSKSEQGAELISWPPIKISGKKKNQVHYWTYKITLNIITIPYEGIPYLNINVQTLRFCNTQVKTRNFKNITTYIKLPDNYKVSRGNHSNSFITAIAEPNLRKVNGVSKWNWKWEYGFEKAMKNIMLDRYIPSIQEVADKPKDFILNDDKASVAIQYGTHIETPRNSKQVGSGVTFADEKIIKEAARVIKNLDVGVSNLFGEFVIKKNNYKTIYNDPKNSNVDFKLDKIPDNLEIEAYYYSDDWLDKLKINILETFNIKAIFHEMVETKINNNNITIINTKTGETKLIKLFPINIKEWDTEEKEFFKIPKNKEDYIEFCKSLKSRVRKSNNTIGAFFELGNKDDFQGYVDPKRTIRKIFAEKNRLTQFITPLDEENENKFISGTRDMLRQLGIINKNISSFRFNTDKNVIYVGLWFTTNKDSRKFPILVAIKGGIPYMSFYKEEDRNVKWQTYMNGQIELGTNPGRRLERNIKVSEKNLKGFIIKAIKQLKDRTGADKIILYSEAQNCRRMLSWYKNKNFGVGKAVLTLEDSESSIVENFVAKGQTLEDCIIVRLRTTNNYEVPNWMKVEFGEGEAWSEKPNELCTGIYSLNDRVYYSIQGKPQTYKPSAIQIRSIKQDNPYKNYMRPNALEIAVPYTYENYEVKDIVKITHFMRKEAAIGYIDPLRLPLPVHLAKSVCEYAEAYYEKIQFHERDNLDE